MKTTTEEKVVITYICEVCKKKYSYKYDALKCEKKHKCEHSIKYEFEVGDEDHPNDMYITNYCHKCHSEIEKLDVEELEDDQHAMSIVFNMIKQKCRPVHL